jgi:hypothetical protein
VDSGQSQITSLLSAVSNGDAGAAELAQVITGQPLSPRAFIDYLRGKYTPLYGC